jgi:hypothetical protein
MKKKNKKVTKKVTKKVKLTCKCDKCTNFDEKLKVDKETLDFVADTRQLLQNNNRNGMGIIRVVENGKSVLKNLASKQEALDLLDNIEKGLIKLA